MKMEDAKMMGFESIVTYFANPLVVWICTEEYKFRGKWETTRFRFCACSKHTSSEVEEYIRRGVSFEHNIRDIRVVGEGLHPAAIAIALGGPVIGTCALCSTPGIVGLRKPLSDIQEIADACRQMVAECNRIRGEADREAAYWRELWNEMVHFVDLAPNT